MNTNISYDSLITLVMQAFNCDKETSEKIITHSKMNGKYNDLIIYVRFNR